MEKSRTILLSVLLIGLLSIGIGFGTYAFFSDTDVAGEYSFTAGTIDIGVNPVGGEDVVTVDGVMDLKPCQTGWTTTMVTNVGPNPCEVWKHVTEVENKEHGVTDAEQEFYDDNPGSENWLISNWIHYDMKVYKPLDYSFSGTSTTYNDYGKTYGIDVDITIEVQGCKVIWTFDFPIDDDLGDGNMGYGLVISKDHAEPAFQIHNNDGTDSSYPWGTHLYSEWGPAGTGYNGWHTSDRNTPVSDLNWVECTGERYHNDNSNGVFTVELDLCRLGEEFYWAAHFGAGGFYDYGGLSKYPDAWDPWSGDATTFETATVATLLKEIPYNEGFYLSGDSGVECNWIYLGELDSDESICVCQSYHLDKNVDNWGQSDRVLFDIEFLGQQTEGSQLPPEPEPVLPGHGRP